MRNNPIVFNDPTGHKEVDGCEFGGCGGVGPTSPVQDRDDDENKDTNDNGVPDVPDPDGVIPHMGGTCTYNNLVECLYDGKYWPSGDYSFSKDEWDQFTLALYYDVYRRAHSNGGFWTLEYDPLGRSNSGLLFVPFHTAAYYDREDYDTPFWNMYGEYEGTICIDGHGCYDRNDVNYVAQGMWSEAAHEGAVGALASANVWKWTQYGHLANSDANYWSVVGSSYYIIHDALPNWEQIVSWVE